MADARVRCSLSKSFQCFLRPQGTPAKGRRSTRKQLFALPLYRCLRISRRGMLGTRGPCELQRVTWFPTPGCLQSSRCVLGCCRHHYHQTSVDSQQHPPNPTMTPRTPVKAAKPYFQKSCKCQNLEPKCNRKNFERRSCGQGPRVLPAHRVQGSGPPR